MPPVGDTAASITPGLEHTLELFGRFRHRAVLLTGASGFVGRSVLDQLERCARLGQHVDVTCVSRTVPSDAAIRYSCLRPTWLQRDVTEGLDGVSAAELVIHAAAPTPQNSPAQDPRDYVSTSTRGTTAVIEWARLHGHRPRVLLTSSGAAEGAETLDNAPSEEDGPTIDSVSELYASGRRQAERAVEQAGKQDVIEAVITRLYTFVGPNQPIDAAYAVTSFMRDAVVGNAIVVDSPQVVRSYLYEEDMAAWILAALVDGRTSTPINVGSGTAVTLLQVATHLASISGVPVISGSIERGTETNRYVPHVEKTCSDLGVAEWTTLHDALRRTLGTYRSRNAAD